MFIAADRIVELDSAVKMYRREIEELQLTLKRIIEADTRLAAAIAREASE